VPAITARGAGETAPPVKRFIALAPTVRFGALAGFRPAELPGPPRDLKAWEAVSDNWELRVAGVADAAAQGHAIADVSATPVDGSRWLIRARCLVFGEGDVVVKLPEGAELLSAQIDGQALPHESARLRLPASADVRSLTLVWYTAAQTERPSLELLRFESGGGVLPISAVSWTVLAPPGLDIEAATRPISPAVAAVRRASALRDFARAIDSQLSTEAKAKLAVQLSAALRHADQALATSPTIAGEPGPDGQTWGEWLKRLHQETPAGDAQAGPEKVEPFAEAFERGAPTYWFAADATPPQMRVQPEPRDRASRAALSIVLVVVVGSGVLVTSRRST
jgi:hypothetical protein